MKKILSQYKVGGHTYTTKKVPTDDDRKGRSNFARVDHSRLLIYVDETLPPTVASCSILHELLHCVMYETGLSSDLYGGKILKEEEVVERVTNSLYQILKDNKIIQ